MRKKKRMNYTIVSIAEADYPVSFGMNALAAFTRNAGLSLKDLGRLEESLDLQNALLLVHCGLADGHRKARKAGEATGQFTLTIEDVGDMLDSDAEAMQKVLSVFSESMPSAKEGNGKAQGGKRKKLVGTI